MACAGDVGDRAGHSSRAQRRAPLLLASAASSNASAPQAGLVDMDLMRTQKCW